MEILRHFVSAFITLAVLSFMIPAVNGVVNDTAAKIDRATVAVQTMTDAPSYRIDSASML